MRAAHRGLPPGRTAHARKAGPGLHLRSVRTRDRHSAGAPKPNAALLGGSRKSAGKGPKSANSCKVHVVRRAAEPECSKFAHREYAARGRVVSLLRHYVCRADTNKIHLAASYVGTAAAAGVLSYRQARTHPGDAY